MNLRKPAVQKVTSPATQVKPPSRMKQLAEGTYKQVGGGAGSYGPPKRNNNKKYG